MRRIFYGKPGKFVSSIWVCKVQRTFYLLARITQDSSHPPICTYFSTSAHDRGQLQSLESRQQHLHYIGQFPHEQNRTLHIYCTLISTGFITLPLLCFPLSFTATQVPIWLAAPGSHSDNSQLSWKPKLSHAHCPALFLQDSHLHFT